MTLRFSSDLRLATLLFGSLWFVCHGSAADCPPCDPGQLCHPPAFPDMLSTFQDTLGHSPVIRNLTEIILSSLALTNCRYSLLTSTDWIDFNARRCTTEADELRSSDEACRHVPSPLDFTRLRPLQPFSLSAESHGDEVEEEEEDYYEEEEEEENEEEEDDDGMEEIQVEKDTYSDDDEEGDEVAVGGWMVSSSRPQSNPRKGLAMYPQGIALIIGISCSILSLVCGIVILIYIRRRYYSHPKYETPPEEAVCLRWMQSRFGVGDGGTNSCQHPCYSTAAEERMRTNPPGHPIKRYL